MQAIERTKDNIVKKQALTYEEIAAEREDVSRLHVILFPLKLLNGEPTQSLFLFLFRSVNTWTFFPFSIICFRMSSKFVVVSNKCFARVVSLQEETQADTESDDDEQQIYNPLKLPMGWDGKPIPYWLYKLHGLGQVITP